MDAWEIPGLKSAVSLDGSLNDPRDTDRGWSVELAFPWKALKELARRDSPPKDGDQWRVNFSRVEWTMLVEDGRYRKTPGLKEHNWVWSPQGVVNMHRPETWGYVQFATAGPGSVTFRPDPSLPARRWLHEVYYAQREFRKNQKRWARTLAELGVTPPDGQPLGGFALETTSDLFQASVELRPASGEPQRWSIRQDSLVWREQQK